MVIDPRKRQKRLERKKSRDKSRALTHRAQERKYAERTLAAIPDAPFLHCCHIEELWTKGIGHVLVSRTLFDNRVAYAVLLLDVYCLGVKDAMFGVVGRAEYEVRVFTPIRSEYALESLSPACMRKLVDGGVAYAQALGLPPHDDYLKARKIFGGVDEAECERDFEYGKDGKPYYIVGPSDLARSRQILRMLREHCGEGGFHFMGPGLAIDIDVAAAPSPVSPPVPD